MELKTLSFMKTTLNNKNDKIVETGSNKAAKSYKLLKSTRTAFAICDSKTISDLFLPILKLIDNLNFVLLIRFSHYHLVIYYIIVYIQSKEK